MPENTSSVNVFDENYVLQKLFRLSCLMLALYVKHYNVLQTLAIQW